MNTHPAAWIPFRVVGAELLKIARTLHLVPAAKNENEAKRGIDGRTEIVTQPESVTQAVPASITGLSIAMPAVVVDFFDWNYVPPQTVPGVPVTGTHWLRLVIAVAVNNTEAINTLEPVNVTSYVSPTYEWFEDDGVLASEQSGVASGGLREYYWYLVKVESGVITQTTRTLLLNSDPTLHA